MAEPRNDPSNHSQSTKVFAAVCLLVIHSIFCIDSFGINGIVPLIQADFNINDSTTAVLGTAASITHTIVLGLVWIFGDSFPRGKLFLGSVSLWIVFNLLAIILGSSSFALFVVFRSLASAASSLYEVLVQVMFADLFTDRALGIAIMSMTATDIISANIIGTINSWIVSNNIAWQYGLIAPPLLAVPATIALFCQRNILRRSDHSRAVGRLFTHAFEVFKIKSYLLLVAAMSLGQFFKRGAIFWTPSFYLAALEYAPQAFLGLSYMPIMTINSLIGLAGSLIGMPVCLWLAQSWYHGTGPFSGWRGFNRAYPVVAAMGSAMNPCAFVAGVLLVDTSYVICLITLFIKGFCLAVSGLNQQMLLMVVPPDSRAAAVALSRLAVQFVAAPSAQIVGTVSDRIRGDSTLAYDNFHAYQMALLFASLFAIAAGIFAIFLVISFPGDLKRAEEAEKDGEEAVDERTPLLKLPNGESTSKLDISSRSRATTEDM